MSLVSLEQVDGFKWSMIVWRKNATKIKVRKAVEECGYLPNQVAKDLKSQKTNLVGVIVPRVSSMPPLKVSTVLTAVLEQAGKHVLLAARTKRTTKNLNIFRC